MLTQRSGIYVIQSKESGNFYVGQSANLQHREWTHWSALRRGVHKNEILQRAFNKYGEDGLEFRVLMYFPENELNKWEQWCLDNWQPEYNIATDAIAPRRGTKFTPEQLQRLSDAHKGIVYGPMSDEHKKKIGDANRGKKRSAELRKQIGDTQRGIPKPALLGELNGQSKLTANDILEIRDRYASGETQTQIAKDYPVASPTISLIVNRKRWGHI